MNNNNNNNNNKTVTLGINLLRRFCFIFLMLRLTTSLAHPPGLSSADVTIKPEGVETKITFAVQDIEAFVPMDSDQDAEVTVLERDAAKPRIAKLVSDEISVMVDGKETRVVTAGTVAFDSQNNATVDLLFAGTPLSSVTVESKFLSRLPPGHKQYVTIRSMDGHELGKKC